MFSGPLAESVPTSLSSFAHRRPRADSITSFKFYDEDQDGQAGGSVVDEGIEETDEEYDEGIYDYDQDEDLERGERQSLRRHSTDQSGNSVEEPLLLRRL